MDIEFGDLDVNALIGQTIAGRYVILEQIGEGGMGSVFKARQEPVGRLVALKILLPEMASNELKLKRFANEARILSALRHPNTVSLFDFGNLPGGQLFIVMDYVEGGTLRDLMDEGRLDELTALRVARQILQSLAEAHGNGIIHRDLKPANVLLDKVPGENLLVKVADFGIAKLDPQHDGKDVGELQIESEKRGFGLHSQLTSPGVRLGTPQYIPPEQAFAKEVDARADFYALGVIMYEMLTGHLPFKSDSDHGLCLEHLYTPVQPINQVHPDLNVDPLIENLLLRLMEKQAVNRPQSSRAIIPILDEVIASLRTEMSSATAPLPLVSPPIAKPERTLTDEPIEFPRKSAPDWLYGLLTGICLGFLVGWQFMGK